MIFKEFDRPFPIENYVIPSVFNHIRDPQESWDTLKKILPNYDNIFHGLMNYVNDTESGNKNKNNIPQFTDELKEEQNLHSELVNKYKQNLQVLNQQTNEMKNIVEFKENNMDDDNKNETLYNKALNEGDNHKNRLKSCQNNCQKLCQLSSNIGTKIDEIETDIKNTENEYKEHLNEYSKIQRRRHQCKRIITDAFRLYNERIKLENEASKKVETTKQKLDKMNLKFKVFDELDKNICNTINLHINYVKNNANTIDLMKQDFIDEINEMEKKWWEWDANKLLKWFKYKLTNNIKLNIDWNKIKQALIEQKINGESLKIFYNNSIYISHIGFKNINIAVQLHEYVKSLIDKYPIYNNNRNDKIDNEAEGHIINTNNLRNIPKKYLCNISKKIMSDPVRAYDGIIYDKKNILRWFNNGNNVSPIIRDVNGNPKKIRNKQLMPLFELKQEILQYKLENSNNNNDDGMDGDMPNKTLNF